MRAQLTLLTIIAEAVLEQRVVADLERAGVTGWSISPARGHGSRGVRASDWEGSNIRVEVLCTDEVSETILHLLETDYFEHFAVVAFFHTVGVLRGEKFGVQPS